MGKKTAELRQHAIATLQGVIADIPAPPEHFTDEQVIIGTINTLAEAYKDALGAFREADECLKNMAIPFTKYVKSKAEEVRKAKEGLAGMPEEAKEMVEAILSAAKKSGASVEVHAIGNVPKDVADLIASVTGKSATSDLGAGQSEESACGAGGCVGCAK